MIGIALHVLRAMSRIDAFGRCSPEYHESEDCLRFLLYPEHPKLEGGEVRCGEHVDSSTSTINLQDGSGGLQVKRADRWEDFGLGW